MIRRTLLAAAAAVALLSAVAAPAEEYRLGLITPPPHQWTVFAQKAADEIRTRTEGRVDIKLFPSGQLGSEAQMLQQMQTGALDFAFLTLGEFANRDPNYGALFAPYLVNDLAGAKTLLAGPAAGKLLDGVQKLGITGLGWSAAGMRIVVMRDPVPDVDALKGKKIRTVPNAPELDFWKGLGAAPTPMPLPALYDALANGQIDGMQLDFDGTWNTKYFQNAKEIVDSRHMMFPMIGVASTRKWAAIPEADRAVVSEVMTRTFGTIIDAYAALDDKYAADLAGAGAHVTKVDRAWFGPAIDAWYAAWMTRAPILAELQADAAAARK